MTEEVRYSGKEAEKKRKVEEDEEKGMKNSKRVLRGWGGGRGRGTEREDGG